MSVHVMKPGSAARWHQGMERLNAMLQHDFCPSANRWVYWLKDPFWVLLLATAISTACGVFLKTEALWITAILILVTLASVAIPWLSIRGIDAQIGFDVTRVRAGQPVIVRLRIRNRWPVPVWGLSVVRGFALREAVDTDEGISVARLPARSVSELSWEFIPVRRGEYPLTPPEIETGFPFGLYRAARRADVTGRVLVWPQTVALYGIPDALASQGGEQRLSERRTGEFGDMLGTRLFRNGDPLRRIHWAQTARQGTLIVSERQASASTAIRIVFDVSGPQPEVAFERAVQVVGSLCESLHRQLVRVELSIHDELLVCEASNAALHRLLDCLAVVQPNIGAGHSGNAVAGHPRRATTSPGRSSAGRFIVVTTSTGQARHAANGRGGRVICVLDDNGAALSVPVWIPLPTTRDVLKDLQSRWKEVCHV